MQEALITEHTNNPTPAHLEGDLHTQANKCLGEAHYLVFQVLPAIMEQLIEQKIWKDKNHDNFGEYAITQSSEGLGISNNDRLLLLKCALQINGRHALEWGDVLMQVDNSVRTYAKTNHIPLRDFSNSLNEADTTRPELNRTDTLTYLPSRSKSMDGQFLKLKKKDEEIYDKVVQGELTFKEAFPPKPRKRLEPIESAKDKFINLSRNDQIAFLAWIDEQKTAL